MRVIGGRFRARQLKTVAGRAVRPTPDRLREALFNTLTPRITGAFFVDAYAGSGAVGIEALSRGARHAVLIEQHSSAVEAIRANVAALGIAADVTIVRGNAARQVGTYPADIVFLDPPYEREDEYEKALQTLGAGRCSLAIAQHASRLALAEEYGSLRKVRVLRQGTNALSYYERNESSEDGSERKHHLEVHDVRAGGSGPDESSDGIEE